MHGIWYKGSDKNSEQCLRNVQFYTGLEMGHSTRLGLGRLCDMVSLVVVRCTIHYVHILGSFHQVGFGQAL